MRFLFVYQDFKEPARKLLDQLEVRDVNLIVALKNADTPTPEELLLLQQHLGAEAAACQLNRKYIKSIATRVTLKYESKKFRIDDQQLKAWLIPVAKPKVTYGKPSSSFITAAQRTPFLVLAPNALDHADELAHHRWAFVSHGADLLARYAAGENLGALRLWKNDHGVEFAANGRVRFKYRLSCDGGQRNGKTEWHLKEGDNTTRESASRIYFERIEFDSGARIIILYVGPHPEDGEYTVNVDVPAKKD